MMLKILYFAVAGIVVLLESCATNHGDHKTDNTNRLLHADHPLVDKIWDVNARQFVSKNEIVAHLQSSDYVLLGETHDNLLHHENQAWVIAQMAKKLNKAAVAFEMINETQGKLIGDSKIENTDALLHVLNKVKTNWDYAQYYTPVFESVFTAGYDIYAANLDRQSIVNIVIKGEQSIAVSIKSLLDKNLFSDAELSIMHQEIMASHCDMLNEESASGMVVGQRVRDAVMALALENNKHENIAILIAGSGHVRRDRGVPTYIRKIDSTAKILSLAWLEVEADMKTVDAYAEQWRSSGLPFDYVWFTAGVERPDPCEEMHKHMQRQKQ